MKRVIGRKIREGDVITVIEHTGLVVTGTVTMVSDWGHYSEVYLGEDQTYYIELENDEEDDTIVFRLAKAPREKSKKTKKGKR